MDNVIMQCNQLANTLKSKYELDNTQKIVLDRAIAKYDYLQNDGTIFTNTMEILECFTHEEKPIAPSKDCIFALCEYIINTIQYYDLSTMIPTIRSNADKQAQKILEGKEV